MNFENRKIVFFFQNISFLKICPSYWKKCHVVRFSKHCTPKNSVFLYLFEDDVDGKLLMERHEISSETEKLKNLLDKEEKVIFDAGITEFEKRKEEYEMIKYSMETACLEVRDICIEKIDNWLDEKRYMLSDFYQAVKNNDNLNFERIKSEYHEKVNNLWEFLMAIETDLVDRLEEAMQEFIRNYAELCENFREQITTSFVQFREFQTEYFEKIKEIAVEASISIAKGDDSAVKFKENPLGIGLALIQKQLHMLDAGDEDEVDEDLGYDDEDEIEEKLSEDAKIKTFVDKETVTVAATNSNDIHTNAIDLLEDEVRTGLEEEQQRITNQIKRC